VGRIGLSRLWLGMDSYERRVYIYIYFCFVFFSFFFSLGQFSLLFAAFWSLNLCFACIFILELESPICVPTWLFLAFGFWFWFHLALVFDVNFTWLLAFVGF